MSCPTDDQLSAYLTGGLDRAAKASIGAHLDRCEDCRQIVVAAIHAASPRPELSTLAVGSHPADPDGLAEPGSVTVGDQLGRYHLLELLGTGGMGQVFLARDLELERDVALKVLRPGLAGSAELLTARLLRESRLMARLSHPSVISVYDVGRHGSLVYVAMELIRGTTLALWLRGRHSVVEVLAAFVTAGRGLVAAHEAGLVHRDFKPDNVLVELAGERVRRVVVTDLGVARALTPSPLSAPPIELLPPPASAARRDLALDGLTTPGATVGTPAYMAPEQLEGRAVDQRADVFAFAVSLWEALWTSRPFPGRTLGEIADAMGRPPVRGAARGHVPRRVVKALAGALQLDVARRTPSLAPLLDAIDPARARRRRTIGLALAGTALVATVAGGLLTPRHRSVDPCERELAQLEAAFSGARMAELKAALTSGGATAEVATGVISSLTELVTRWKTTGHRVCIAGHATTAIACLQARQAELLGVADDLRAERALQPMADRYLQYLGDPAACEHPMTGMLFARVPTEAALRAPVRQLRARIDAAEQLRDQGQAEAALVQLRELRAAAEPVWLPLFAEALAAEGTTEAQSGDSNRGSAILKQAVAVAGKAHDDHVAAAAWNQLISCATFSDHDTGRALEYATSADAALDRIGRPPADELMFLYYYGATLVQADRPAEGEVKLRAAYRLAERVLPTRVPLIIQGLAFLYDHEGDYAKAIALYRQAIAGSIHQPRGSVAIYRAQLANNLVAHGDGAEALQEAERAIADAQGVLDPHNDEWYGIDFAKVLALRQLGRFDEALAALVPAQARATASAGARSAEVAIYQQMQALLLSDTGQLEAAATLFTHACEGLGYTAEEIDYAGCLADQAHLELRAGRVEVAAQHASRSIEIIERLGSFHPDVALVYQVRGEAARRRGDLAHATADLDRALEIANADADPGLLASARLAKARLLAATDRAAAAALVRDAIATWKPRPGLWRRELGEAEALLTRLGR